MKLLPARVQGWRPLEFSCPINTVIQVGANTCQRVDVVLVFRSIPAEAVDNWVMPNGRPRSDRELADEVLLDVQTTSQSGFDELWKPIRISDVLSTDRGTAMVVSAFLAALPRVDAQGQGME